MNLGEDRLLRFGAVVIDYELKDDIAYQKATPAGISKLNIPQSSLVGMVVEGNRTFNLPTR
jgi:hypothetical protein